MTMDHVARIATYTAFVCCLVTLGTFVYLTVARPDWTADHQAVALALAFFGVLFGGAAGGGAGWMVLRWAGYPSRR